MKVETTFWASKIASSDVLFIHRGNPNPEMKNLRASGYFDHNPAPGVLTMPILFERRWEADLLTRQWNELTKMLSKDLAKVSRAKTVRFKVSVSWSNERKKK